MKNFNNKRLTANEARNIQGNYDDKCGSNSWRLDRFRITLNGKISCRDAEFIHCPNNTSRDVVGAKVDWYTQGWTQKTDITCYVDDFGCTGGFIGC